MTLGLPLATISAFLVVLARVSGLIAFFPLPAISQHRHPCEPCSR